MPQRLRRLRFTSQELPSIIQPLPSRANIREIQWHLIKPKSWPVFSKTLMHQESDQGRMTGRRFRLSRTNIMGVSAIVVCPRLLFTRGRRAQKRGRSPLFNLALRLSLADFLDRGNLCGGSGEFCLGLGHVEIRLLIGQCCFGAFLRFECSGFIEISGTNSGI